MADQSLLVIDLHRYDRYNTDFILIIWIICIWSSRIRFNEIIQHDYHDYSGLQSRSLCFGSVPLSWCLLPSARLSSLSARRLLRLSYNFLGHCPWAEPWNFFFYGKRFVSVCAVRVWSVCLCRLRPTPLSLQHWCHSTISARSRSTVSCPPGSIIVCNLKASRTTRHHLIPIWQHAPISQHNLVQASQHHLVPPYRAVVAALLCGNGLCLVAPTPVVTAAGLELRNPQHQAAPQTAGTTRRKAQMVLFSTHILEIACHAHTHGHHHHVHMHTSSCWGIPAHGPNALGQLNTWCMSLANARLAKWNSGNNPHGAGRKHAVPFAHLPRLHDGLWVAKRGVALGPCESIDTHTWLTTPHIKSFGLAIIGFYMCLPAGPPPLALDSRINFLHWHLINCAFRVGWRSTWSVYSTIVNNGKRVIVLYLNSTISNNTITPVIL